MGYFKFNYQDPNLMQPELAALVEGEASFKISAIWDKKQDGTPLTTTRGIPKLTVSFNVIDCKGQNGRMYDDLTANTAWKIKALLDAVGLGQLYKETGEFNPDDLLHCTGRCLLGFKEDQNGDKKLIIKKYLNPKAATENKDYSSELPEDDIPF